MKKTKTFAKKLALSKVTVANLNKTELNEVKGGRVSGNCWTGPQCTWSCLEGCPGAGGTWADCVTYTCTILPECEG